MARKREAGPAWSLAGARADNFSLPGRSRRITVQPAELPEPIETPEPEPVEDPMPADAPPPGEPSEEPFEPEPVEPAPEREPEKTPA